MHLSSKGLSNKPKLTWLVEVDLNWGLSVLSSNNLLIIWLPLKFSFQKKGRIPLSGKVSSVLDGYMSHKKLARWVFSVKIPFPCTFNEWNRLPECDQLRGTDNIKVQNWDPDPIPHNTVGLPVTRIHSQHNPGDKRQNQIRKKKSYSQKKLYELANIHCQKI